MARPGARRSQCEMVRVCAMGVRVINKDMMLHVLVMFFWRRFGIFGVLGYLHCSGVCRIWDDVTTSALGRPDSKI